jgi:hypothetical protein
MCYNKDTIKKEVDFMKKIDKLDVISIIVAVVVCITMIYAFIRLYQYKWHESPTQQIVVTTDTTLEETTTETKTNWSEEFEKSFRAANAQYKDIANDVNQNITTIEPVEHPDFN